MTDEQVNDQEKQQTQEPEPERDEELEQWEAALSQQGPDGGPLGLDDIPKPLGQTEQDASAKEPEKEPEKETEPESEKPQEPKEPEIINPFLKPPKQPEPKAEQEEELLELPEGQAPKAEQFAQLREQAKKFRSGYAELQEKIAEQEKTLESMKAAKAAEQVPQPAEAPQQPQQQYRPAHLFDLMAKARTGELYDEESKNQLALREAKTIASGYSPAEIAGALEELDLQPANESGDVARQMMLTELAKANSRELTEREAKAKEAEEQRQFMEKYQQSLMQLQRDFPQLRDPESEHIKVLPEFTQRFVGVADDKGNIQQPGVLAPLLSQPDWPVVLAQLVDLYVRANKTVDHDALAKQNTELKAELDKLREPEAATAAAGNGQTSQEVGGDAEFERIMRRLGDATPAELPP